MRTAAAQFSGLFLLAALVLPSVGPLVDHHFAERQPGHLHARAYDHHDHKHAYQHTHPHDSEAEARSDGLPIALYNYEKGPAGTVVIVADDAALLTVLAFEPSSLLALPQPALGLVKEHHPAPPEKPPQHPL